MGSRWRTTLGLGALAAGLTTAAIARGWEVDQAINTSIHAHSFDRIEMERLGESCKLGFVLHFSAPSSGYQDPAPVRNLYRFKARVSLNDRRRVYSGEFVNRAPGRRVYRWQHDTTAEGCWAAQPAKIYYVDVEGCRVKNCTVEPFKGE